MKNYYFLFVIILLINGFIPSFATNLKSNSLQEEKVIAIDQDVQGDSNHKRGEYEYKQGDTEKNRYFKYTFSGQISSLITTFSIKFDTYSTDISNYKVLCANFPSSVADATIISTLKALKPQESACIDGFVREARFDGAVRFDQSKTVLGIMLQEEKAGLIFNGRVVLRVNERKLTTDDLKPNDDETNTLIPYSIKPTSFREKEISKILFYSYSRNLQMLYPGSSPFPDKLFTGNILNVYTNPNMIRQKYHNAQVMTLIVNPRDSSNNDLKEDFQFEVKHYKSDYLLDYYVSSNTEGRKMNRPLLINMTECTNPYYAILNYNQPEGKKVLIIDQIYGKFKSLHIANVFTQSNWDDMISKDMKEIDIHELKYHLPENTTSHIDVYKIECELPLMFNFYFTDENDLITKMNYGDINIFTLEPLDTVNIPIFDDIVSPEIVIEVFNPNTIPTVLIHAHDDDVVQINSLIRIVPMTLPEGITIKERGGVRDTRIIVKLGYPNRGWDKTDDDNVFHNKNFDVYAFRFPLNNKMYNYTDALLRTSGTNKDDNVKYCFNANIGAALEPSPENCIRVSKDNSYFLKLYNSLIMYRDYNYDSENPFYITFKTETEATEFTITSELKTYDTETRNFIGENNKVTLASGKGSSIITPPDHYNSKTFLQIQVCDNSNSIKAKITKPLTKETIVNEIDIPAGSKNKYIKFDNIFLDSEIYITGNDNTKVFLREAGLPYDYTPTIDPDYKVTFDSNTNSINIQCPLKGFEYMEYTIFIDKKGVLKEKGLTLCDFVYYDIDKIALYHKEIGAFGYGTAQINFKQIGFNVGDEFDAIVYIEQRMFSTMAFLSDVIQGQVGDITYDKIHEISLVHPKDPDYVYKEMETTEDDASFYFTFQPEKSLEVPFGALRVELDEKATGSFTGLFCGFVENTTDPLTIIEEIEKKVDEGSSYCVGGQSKTNSKRYNYIFRYDQNKDDNSPLKLVIKLINGNLANGKFNIYIRKEEGEKIERTGFEEQKKYGQNEKNKLSIVPYIVDLKTIRGEETDPDKVSKILFYSENSEMQMYYILDDQTADEPKKLFSGNIALVLTNTSLAIQKYHATTLILLSEDPQEDSTATSFRFHTKMFRSEDQIEYFVSENSEGRTLNFPLSLEMTQCNDKINKLYYILNYNKQEPMRTLHLDMIFGSYKTARIARDIKSETWDDLIKSMTAISYYQAILPEKEQHIDVVEVQCESPFLLNAYYSYSDYSYSHLRQGEIVVKDLNPGNQLLVTIDPQDEDIFYYTLSLYSHEGEPDFTLRFSDGTEHSGRGNSMQEGILYHVPQNVTFINNARIRTRFIFKIGLNVEKGKDWKEETSTKRKGRLFVNENKYVYKFPVGTAKRDFKNVQFLVTGINEVENVKFCYSTNLGVALEASRENCFRTGRYIPYTLTFINPLTLAKDYNTTCDDYYISFKPYTYFEHISLKITENTYDAKDRNEEGQASLLKLDDNKQKNSILSVPQFHTSQILIQIRSCTDSELPVKYELFNAFSGDLIKEGKTYYRKDIGYGIIYVTDETWTETEIKLTANESESETVKAFVKHVAIGNNKVVLQKDFTELYFDPTKNSIKILKPIINEEFSISVVADLKGKLSGYSQCDFSFGDIQKIGKYHKTFDSKSSNTITHFIDFASVEMDEGTEFDLLVYAKQKYNSKMEFLYPLFQDKVGKLSGVEKVETYIQDDYASLNFKYNLNSNYLYFDFPKSPLGQVASLKILSPAIGVTKVGCVFVSKSAAESTMIAEVNNAMANGTNICLDLGSSSNNEFNALIKAKLDGDKSRLVMQVIYGLGKDDINVSDEGDNTINIKIAGTEFGDSTGKHTLDEKLAPTPYVVNLEEIRKKSIDGKYVSKVLFYSNTTKMTMHYISDDSTAPATLFEGNVMLVYTNEDLIYQKYHGAKQMILTTDAISNTHNIIDVKYFDSDTQIQYYYLGSDATGRVLNNPTAIEMTSCDLPYYYILNYNQVEEGNRKLHIDNIFGEVDSMKIATSLDYNTWNELLDNMLIFDNEQIILPKTQYPFDIIEVKCKLPLLLNLYYADPNDVKTENLEIGDIVILSLKGNSRQRLTFKPGQAGPFVYSFNIFQDYNVKPNIEILFDGESDFIATENGLHIKDSWMDFTSVTIVNLDKSSGINTRVIFKIGYVIESTFKNIGDGVYQNIDTVNRTINLYGYKYVSTSKKLNYTGVDFDISTLEDNVKFCYSTNLGAYINPSLNNCFRVGKKNPYTIHTRNPLIMYKNYYQDNVNNYYVGFRTTELNKNIIIKPKLIAYDTPDRNFEDINKKIKLEGESHSLILTAPSTHNAYLFTYISVCTSGEGLSYEFYNAYNGSNLGYNDHITSDPGYDFKSVPNTKLDTELKLIGKAGLEVFVRHIGLDYYYQPDIATIKIKYNAGEKKLSWNQPIEGEEFRYEIYIDKLNNIRDKGYTLCSVIDTSKLARFHDNITTNDNEITYTVDFSKPDLADLTDFDAIIVAQQISNGKLIFLSPLFSTKDSPSDEPDKPSGTNTGLIVIVVVLSVVLIGGGIGAYFIIKKYRSKGVIVADGKATSMAMIGSTKNEKLVESQVAVDP